MGEERMDREIRGTNYWTLSWGIFLQKHAKKLSNNGWGKWINTELSFFFFKIGEITPCLCSVWKESTERKIDEKKSFAEVLEYRAKGMEFSVKFEGKYLDRNVFLSQQMGRQSMHIDAVRGIDMLAGIRVFQ